MSNGIKIEDAEIKKTHVDVDGNSYIPIGNAETDESMAISINEIRKYISSIGSYTFTQLTPLSIWIVHHNLESIPIISLTTENGDVMYADIDNTNNNTSVISFSIPVTGIAHCTK